MGQVEVDARRTIDEWRKMIGTTLDNTPKMGGWQWGMVVLLSQIALILLDIRESLFVMAKRGK